VASSDNASNAQETVGTLATALAHTARLLGADPAMAATQANEILKVVPGHPEALLLLAAALRLQNKLDEALKVLMPLTAAHPGFAAAWLESGLTLAALGQTAAAIPDLRRAVALNPALTNAWRALGDELTLAGDSAGADAAYAQHIKSSVKDPELLEAAAALCDNQLGVAERILRGFLKRYPTDVAAIRMLAEIGIRLGRLEDAANLLERCLELAPSFAAARHNYASLLFRQQKSEETIAQVDQLLKADPRHPGYRSLKAASLVRIGEYAGAITNYEAVLKEFPGQPKTWMSYGHTLKTVGRPDDSIAAYRKAIALMPSLGEAYWSMANLKTFRFTDDEIKAMGLALELPGLTDDDRLHLHFSLGKALEDAGDYASAFENYAKGNAIRRSLVDYDPQEVTRHKERSIALFTPEFFGNRAGQGDPAPDPIFIVGLPRAGSTLIEQILSSHSAVEGTMELPDIIAIATRLGGRKRKNLTSAYPEVLADLDADEFRALGQEYLDRTRIQRKLGKPFFIDKMPNNFAHVGLIHLILPNAKIIDARRHPLAASFSGFKQHFARGQNFTYSLTDIAQYYRDYARLMAHFDRVLPGRIHRVNYENMVADMEGETRRLLEHCNLPFEENCLRFYENERAVRTASSEQVRQPIFSDAVDHWRNFEIWLGPAAEILEPILAEYPAT
jgi:tetratricopeptide (TPR) repeat protein